MQGTPVHAPAAPALTLQPGAPAAALDGQRVRGARVAYSLRLLRDDVARVPGVWCDGTGACAPGRKRVRG